MHIYIFIRINDCDTCFIRIVMAFVIFSRLDDTYQSEKMRSLHLLYKYLKCLRSPLLYMENHKWLPCSPFGKCEILLIYTYRRPILTRYYNTKHHTAPKSYVGEEKNVCSNIYGEKKWKWTKSDNHCIRIAHLTRDAQLDKRYKPILVKLQPVSIALITFHKSILPS